MTDHSTDLYNCLTGMMPVSTIITTAAPDKEYKNKEEQDEEYVLV